MNKHYILLVGRVQGVLKGYGCLNDYASNDDMPMADLWIELMSVKCKEKKCGGVWVEILTLLNMKRKRLGKLMYIDQQCT